MPVPTERPAAVATVTVWGVPARKVPVALARMARGRGPLRPVPGLRFSKLLGTAAGFGPRDTDLRHWALVAAWDSAEIADDFAAHGAVAHAWAADADETLHVSLRPLSSRGSWSGKAPFTPVASPPPPTGPVAALTRARVRLPKWRRFSSAVPPVVGELHEHDALRLALGLGEAPIGFQGTFSIWESADALRQFAYRDPAHAGVVAATPREDWYAEELFARFEVVEAEGTYRGRSPL